MDSHTKGCKDNKWLAFGVEPLVLIALKQFAAE